MSERMVPIYVTLDGKDELIAMRPESYVRSMPNVRLRERKGRIRRAYVESRPIVLINLTRDGYCREQVLLTGHVYALVGTTGSRDEES